MAHLWLPAGGEEALPVRYHPAVVQLGLLSRRVYLYHLSPGYHVYSALCLLYDRRPLGVLGIFCITSFIIFLGVWRVRGRFSCRRGLSPRVKLPGKVSKISYST